MTFPVFSWLGPAHAVQVVVLLLLLASLVSAFIGYLKIPYTVGLVIAGILLDLLRVLPAETLNPDLVLWVLLPPLLFEAAFTIRWDTLLRVGLAVLIFATLGVLLAGFITAAIIVFVLHLPVEVAVLFGVLVSATDPVAVVALFRQMPVPSQLRTFIEGESMLNDGTVVVLGRVLALFFVGGQLSVSAVVGDFIGIALGGLGIGVLVGLIASLITRRIDDYLVETTLSVVVAYGSYALAEGLGTSGVLAAVGAGIALGNVGRRIGMSEQTQTAITLLWEFLAFVANSFVFLLLGLAVVPRALLAIWPNIVVGVLAAWLGRAVLVYGLGTLIALVIGRPKLAWQHVIFWGGLRGALPVVVAISLAEGLHLPSRLPTLVLGVVVVSLLIQGMTLEPVIKRALNLRR
ncbi:MAG TPA: cation:proton antiporter [Chloroflexota bacterium]|nr:cation:proton antiporter [Chloroflexota bacterium]